MPRQSVERSELATLRAVCSPGSWPTTHRSPVVSQAGSSQFALGALLADPSHLDGGVITSVSVHTGGVGAYESTARTPADIPIVLIAGHAAGTGTIRLAATGVGETPIIVDPDQIEDLDPQPDFRGSADYRRHLAGVLSQRVHRPFGCRRHTVIVNVTVNGEGHEFECAPHESLRTVLRREGYYSVRFGSETGETGAAAVLVDGQLISADIMLAAQADGHTIETVEGLASPLSLHPIQEAFIATGAIQSGYATPATILAAKSAAGSQSRSQ